MKQLPSKVLIALQHRAARIAIGSSSMRGRGNVGVIKAGRAFLGDLSLRRFGTSNRTQFIAELDRATDNLVRRLPRTARYWGLARKGLNIFLRDCLYTIYLRDANRLGRAEQFFEIPLDSLTGGRLYKEAKGRLPRWRTVRGLSRSVSDAFQYEAMRVGRRQGIAKVHLDAEWWGKRRSKTAG